MPPSKPKASLSVVTLAAAKRWARDHAGEALPEFYVLAVRAYYSETIAPDGNNLSAYDDAFFIVSPFGMTAWNGNTDPSRYGLRPDSSTRYMARLKPGCYKFISLTHRGSYQAFGQGPHPVMVERIRRDGTIAQTETGEFGINLHRGGINGTSSEGCLTLPVDQFDAFRQKLNRTMQQMGVNSFDLILIDGPIA